VFLFTPGLALERGSLKNGEYDLSNFCLELLSKAGVQSKYILCELYTKQIQTESDIICAQKDALPPLLEDFLARQVSFQKERQFRQEVREQHACCSFRRPFPMAKSPGSAGSPKSCGEKTCKTSLNNSTISWFGFGSHFSAVKLGLKMVKTCRHRWFLNDRPKISDQSEQITACNVELHLGNEAATGAGCAPGYSMLWGYGEIRDMRVPQDHRFHSFQFGFPQF